MSSLPHENTYNWVALIDQAHGRVKPPQSARRVGKRLNKEHDETASIAENLCFKDRTEDGYAVEFVTEYQGQFCYTAESNSWYVWDSHVWVEDTKGCVTNLVRQYVRQVRELNTRLSADSRTTPSMIRRLNSDAGTKALLSLAKTDPRVAVSVTDFDLEKEELNTPAGVVDLRTGQVRELDPTELVMRSTTVAPADIETPVWDKFLAETFQGCEDAGEYFMQMLGVTLVGGQDTQTFLYNFGVPASGKSTAIKVAQLILGDGKQGYSVTCDHRMFEKSGKERHPTEIAKLVGARMAVSSEIAKGAALDADKFKMLVSGDRLTARYMRQDEFEFYPNYTLWIMSNHGAKAPSSESAFWRRIRVIPFRHTVPEPDRIQGFAEHLYNHEGPGILHKMIQAAHVYLTEGYLHPYSVIAETEEHMTANDTFAAWLEDATYVPEDGKGFALVSGLRKSYVSWTRLNNYPDMGLAEFKEALDALPYNKTRRNSGIGYEGLSVQTEFDNILY